ncbi:MAG: GtrA family protein [Actinomycetia bacterium]|nr:GtrA family protein [Actinomycetes bacterium]
MGSYLYERGKARMALPAAGLYTRYRHLLPELLKFGVVGGIGAVIDLGGAALLHGKYHVGPLGSKAISTTLAMVVTYLGSRFWTFKHRENQALGREAGLFLVLNVVGLLVAEVVIALVTYGFGRHSQLEYNAASVVGTGMATIFRYIAYRRWVFTAPAEQSVLAPAAPDELAAIPDYPPWEGDPAYLAAEVRAAASATSWESDGAHSWGPVSEGRSWDDDPERTQPWMEFSNDPVASPYSPASAGTGQSLIGGADPAASGARGQGRHRRG